MKVLINDVNFNANKELLDYVQQKVSKLDRFYDHILEVEVYLKTNNEPLLNKTVEVKINAPGQRLFAREHARKFETACNKTVTAIQQQIRKLKTKKTKGRS